MLETEVKIKIDNEKVNEITRFLGNPDYIKQTNIIYQNCQGFLRLRREAGRTIVTYKGKRLDDKFGSREEIEFSIPGEDNFVVLRDILKRMGLEETLYYNKKRASFDFGPCLIALDQVIGGSYLEIESGNDGDIEKTMDFFGLDEQDIERRAYHELLKK